MFETTAAPRVFGVAPGVDFPRALAEGLRARLLHQPPEAMARVEVIVNTARMRTRLREVLIAQGPGFLPRITLIGELSQREETENPLRIRLELAQAIRVLLQREPDIAPPSAAFSLADGLFALLDEMQSEGVDLDILTGLNVSNHSEHWTRSLRFIRLIADHFGPVSGVQGRLRRAVLDLIARWQTQPPGHPVLVAGSTGSRGPAQLLMRAVARLPQGALILPGFDNHMPPAIWKALDDLGHDQDHPQYRYARLIGALAIGCEAVNDWAATPPPNAARNALVSLALRPAPVTDQWLRDGPLLGDLRAPTAGLSLIEAKNPRQEALVIALCLRQAAVEGRKAALITPDRVLARRVTAALDRWLIRPDDSAGRPLALSAPGRYLRQCAALMGDSPSAEALMALLKHPIAHSAADRGPHLRHLHDLELYLRRKALPYPDAAALAAWAGGQDDRAAWAAWLSAALEGLNGPAVRPLTDWNHAHLALAHHLAAGGTSGDSGELWRAASGADMRALFDELTAQATHGGEMSLIEYCALLETILLGREVREIVESHPHVMIWGTLEARAQGADLIVLGGLIEGTWPATPAPDPWFNRAMRAEAGLLSPERAIGLAAHDFQQAVAGAEVVLSRAQRNAEAETVPSRWLNRLLNLIGGLEQQGGDEALKAMRARGQHWLTLAQRFDDDLSDVPACVRHKNPRPAPAPPLSARPRELSVTRIEKLIRDPYAIYAQYVLNLRRLDPLAPQPDARLRGTALHEVLDRYVRAHPPGTPGDIGAFMAIAERVLAETCPWRAIRLHWLARLQQTAEAFVAWNANLDSALAVTEEMGRWQLADPPFRLIGKPDRIDRAPDGQVWIYDYKTGTLPSGPQQKAFNKQLILLAMMVEDGAFEGLGSGLGSVSVGGAAFVGLGREFKQSGADVTPDSLQRHRAELAELLRAYASPDQGFTAMRRVEREARIDDYHPLARRGEWQPTDPAQTIKVGEPDG